MPQVVEVPGMGDVEFPDDMNDDQIAAAIRQNMQPAAPAQSPAMQSAPAGFPQMPFGPYNMPGLSLAQKISEIAPTNIGDVSSPGKMAAAIPETALHLGSGAVAAPVAGLAGLAASPFIGNDRSADLVRNIQNSMTYEPRSLQGQTLTKGVTAPLAAIQFAGRKAGEGTTDLTGSPAAGTAVDTLINALPMLAGARGRGPVRDGKLQPETIPTKEQLKADSSAAYKHSEEIGAVVSEPRFQAFQKELGDTLQKEGIDKDLHPDASAAMRRVLNESGPMTLEKIETLRRIAQDAEGSIKPADARNASNIVDSIDSMVESLKPEDLAAGTPEAAASLKQARDLWKRARKADVLDELMRRAELSAPNFSASGMENAIRTEFRALAKNERRFRRFSKEEQAAIARVAKGGPLENTMRFLGKAAPTGIVSTGLGTSLGFMLGGPAGAAAVPALGAVSRLGARGLTGRNARLANELVRAGRKADSFLSYAALDTSPAALGRGPARAPAPTARPIDTVESEPWLSVSGSNDAVSSGSPGYESLGMPKPRFRITNGDPVPQVPGKKAGKKSIEQLYLEALVEEMRGR